MNKQTVLNTVLWVILFLFLLPSSLAVASWNSLPGSRLFSTKLFMEQALVFVIPSAAARGNLQITYTERRFSDASRMLADQSSVQGLSYLDTQVNTTKNAILTTTDPVVKKQLAQKYIASLQDVSTHLEEQKQIAAALVPPGSVTAPYAPPPVNTPTPFFQPTATPILPPAYTTVIQQPTEKVAPTPTSAQTRIQIPTSTPILISTQTPVRIPTPTTTPLPPATPVNVPTETATQESIVVSISTSQQEIRQTIEEMKNISEGDLQNNKNKSGNDKGRNDNNKNDNTSGSSNSDGNNKGH